MTTAIDSNVLIALWNQDDSLNTLARSALDAALERGSLVITAPAFAELMAAPSFFLRLADEARAHPRTENFLDSFCKGTAIAVDWDLSQRVWRAAGRVFQEYVARRRQRESGLRRFPDRSSCHAEWLPTAYSG